MGKWTSDLTTLRSFVTLTTKFQWSGEDESLIRVCSWENGKRGLGNSWYRKFYLCVHGFSTLAWRSQRARTWEYPICFCIPGPGAVFVKTMSEIVLVSPSDVGLCNFPVWSEQQRVEGIDRAGLDFSGLSSSKILWLCDLFYPPASR